MAMHKNESDANSVNFHVEKRAFYEVPQTFGGIVKSRIKLDLARWKIGSFMPSSSVPITRVPWN